MPTHELVICPATAGDLDVVGDIYAHYVTSSVATFDENPPEASDWQRKLDDLNARHLPFLIARAGDEIVGFAYAAPWRVKPAYRYSVEDTIYLAPDRTGRGTGRALLDALLRQCAASGVRQVIAVIADTGSDASVTLHRSVGFREVGRLTGVGHKHGRWIDTVLMQLDLTDQS
ncbi:GNAT family N-acetyltransferase [Micromonospora polyrhachis]|uniref:Phosphinothricin acetyltransferase n=1 Tax=Micromonospora polyrhachis TaxID=1282883 RepID=A0A7W7SRT8_9ACTN|nr:GNAT family N-acetyltransferase [Micromonospora polyrhachis]MBB4959631.1 phosphinothricin acetyltransferase [Micromonospora polyrhachis]